MVLRRAFLSSRVRHSRSLRHPEAPFLESPRRGNARFSQHAVHASRRLAAPHLVDASEAPAGYDHSAVVYEDAISEEEHDALVSDFTARLKRRRYERGHWDAVIVKYKETELFDEESSLSPQSRSALDRIRALVGERHFGPLSSTVRWLPCHVIDYHADGELNAHVDSIRFSGKTVSGLSLLSPAIMRLRPAPDAEDPEADSDSYHVTFSTPTDGEAGHVDLLLPPRSLYVLSRASRYQYTHELRPDHSRFLGLAEPVARSHRMSVIFRDALPDE